MRRRLGRSAEWLARGGLFLASTLVSLAAVEGLVALALAHPQLLAETDRPLALVRDYYRRQDRRIVQFLPECAVYDSQLTYTLAPGRRCAVVNREHTVEYAANSAGLRGSEEELRNPLIAVLGDSHAMGWGVAEDEAFPHLLQERLGVRVLNTAISSYGTARELTLLDRLALASVRVRLTSSRHATTLSSTRWGSLSRVAEAARPPEPDRPARTARRRRHSSKSC